jgi:hypothetical protein
MALYNLKYKYYVLTVYFIMLCQHIGYSALDDRMTVNKKSGRRWKRLYPNLRSCPRIFIERLKNT